MNVYSAAERIPDGLSRPARADASRLLGVGLGLPLFVVDLPGPLRMACS